MILLSAYSGRVSVKTNIFFCKYLEELTIQPSGPEISFGGKVFKLWTQFI